MKIHTLHIIIGLLLVALFVTACSQKPAEIHYGSDECAHCRMMITDNRFASQVVTKTGKAIKFDAIECLAIYAGDNKSELESAKFWVSDFNNPGNWVEINDAEFVKSDVINSPMGASLLAFGSEKAATKHLDEYSGKAVKWQQIVK